MRSNEAIEKEVGLCFEIYAIIVLYEQSSLLIMKNMNIFFGF